MLQPNPMRDFSIDPIDDEVVEKLRQSIEEDGFWGGVVCRRLPDGTIQTGAGHHRVKAAIAAGITTADLYVADDLDDSDMVRIYTRENATQRGNSGTAMAGSVAAALRLLVKAALTGNLCRILQRLSERAAQTIAGQLTAEKSDGLGRDLIIDYFHEQHIQGMGDYTVQQQLANLKASGAYTRILTEIEAEIEQEREEARQAAEEERRRLEQAERERRDAEIRRRQAEEAERRAQEERRAAAARVRAAREERERAEAEERRRKAEEDARRAELVKKESEALAASLERQRQETEARLRAAEAERQKRDAAATKARKAAEKAEQEAGRTFDFEGVSRHLKNPYQISTFRDLVTRGLAAQHFRVEDHEALAARIVEEARKVRQSAERVTAEFIKAVIDKEVWAARQAAEAVDREEERRQLEESYVARAQRYQEDIARHFRGISGSGQQLIELLADWPAGLTFPMSGAFQEALRQAKQLMDRLVERIDR
jgi:hypothetical protein